MNWRSFGKRDVIFARACLKKAFRELRVSVCGRFYPNEGGVAGYGNRMRVKYTAKWGLQIAEMIFQTRSNTTGSSIAYSISVQFSSLIYLFLPSLTTRKPTLAR